MKPSHWVQVMIIGLAATFILSSWANAAPTPNNCGVNMLCRVQTLIVNGNTTVGGTLTTTGAISAGSANITTTGKFCTTVACNTNNITNDTFGKMNIAGPVSGNNNLEILGTTTSTDYFIASTGLKNTGTAAACSSNTGAVCVNDTGGLAVADGAGATVTTVSAAGLGTFVNLHATGTPTVGTITLSVGSGTATVLSGAICVCSETTDATKTVKCAVSATTLTATGTGSDVIAYVCL